MSDIKIKERPARNTVEHVPGEHVPVGPVVIATDANKNGRLSGHLYDIHSGVYMGPASDEQKAKPAGTIFNIRHIKVRVEP